MIKKVLPLLWITSSLVLCGCTNEKHDTNHTINQNNDVYENVWYEFIHEKHCYCVTINAKQYNVPLNKYYLIVLNDYLITKDGKELLKNEYYITTNELFVYYKQ